MSAHDRIERDSLGEVRVAAAALWVAGLHDSLLDCVRLAGEAIDGGAARDLLARLVEVSRSS